MEGNSWCVQGNLSCLVSTGDVIFSAVSLVCGSGDRCQSTPIIYNFDSSRKMSLTFVLWQTFCNIHLVEQNWEEGQWPSPQWPLSPRSEVFSPLRISQNILGGMAKQKIRTGFHTVYHIVFYTIKCDECNCNKFTLVNHFFPLSQTLTCLIIFSLCLCFSIIKNVSPHLDHTTCSRSHGFVLFITKDLVHGLYTWCLHLLRIYSLPPENTVTSL